MTRADYQLLVVNLRDIADQVARGKQQDYSPREDVLENFKRDGSFLQLDPKLVCCVYLTKHFQAILNGVHGSTLVVEDLEHRVVDMYNYLQLLYALVKEEP